MVEADQIGGGDEWISLPSRVDLGGESNINVLKVAYWSGPLAVVSALHNHLSPIAYELITSNTALIQNFSRSSSINNRESTFPTRHHTRI